MQELSPFELEGELQRMAVLANEAERASIEPEETFKILNDLKDASFARITEAQVGKTTAEKERKALLTDDWQEWLAGYQTARRIALEAKVESKIAVRNYETCRSVLSSVNIGRRTTI